MTALAAVDVPLSKHGLSKMTNALEGLTLAPADGTLGPAPGQLSRAGTHYLLSGPPDGALTVLVSGLGNFSFTFEKLGAARAAAGRRVLTYDQYGKGWSHAPAGCRYDAAAHDAQLAALLEELGLADQPLSFITHSMGGIVGAVYTTLRPAYVRELILLAPAGAMRSPVPFFRAIQATLRYSTSVLLPFVASITDVPPPFPGDYSGPDAAAFHHDWDVPWVLASRREHGNQCFAARLAHMPFTNLAQHLQSLRAPAGSSALRVLLLRGESDTIVRDIDLEMWRGAFPSAAEFRADPPLRGGHGFVVEFPEATPVILDFLRGAATQ